MSGRAATAAGWRACSRALLPLAVAVAPAAGCSDGSEPAGPGPVPPHEPVVYPLSPKAYTALQAVWEPLLPSAATLAAIEADELTVTDVERFAEHGLGVRLAAGHDWVEHLDLAPHFASARAGTRKSLLYLWQVADPQIIDEESPIRFEAFAGLYRPHGHLSPQLFEAHVRTAERLSELSGRPFDFALLAGDLTDGSQLNELDWMLTVLNGGALHPDSGADDDPVAGAGNDYNDPFISDGLDVPWYAVLGNHESLYNGGFGAITDEVRAAAVGPTIYDHPLFPNGYCDGSTPQAKVVVAGSTPPDERRLPLRLGEVLQQLAEAGGQPPGHGLSAADVAAERGYFSVHPLEGKPIRLIGLDTVHSLATGTGSAQGWFEAEQLAWLEQQLAAADAADELVLVMSHHRAEDLADASPVSGDELTAVLAAAEGVVLHMVGHEHLNGGRNIPEPTGATAHGYWELMLASNVDFPSQSRIIEIVDEDNGYLSIYATNVGHNATTDSLAQRGRELAAAKRVFGTVTNKTPIDELWQADLPAQNLLLRVPIPDAVRAKLAEHTWPTRIESEQTLAALPGP